MAMNAGDADTPDTMAKAILDSVDAEFGTTTGQLLIDRKRMCKAIAEGVVAHLAAFADVRITTSNAGLQRDNTGGNPATLAPVADVVLSGAVE